MINPCDYEQTKSATLAIAKHQGPVYLRFGRPAWPVFMKNKPFEIGKAIKLIEGTDVTIFATGHMVWKAIEAEKELEQQGISAEVINIHTLKPLDEQAILKSINKTKCVVTAEEHQITGGLGDAVAQTIVKNHLVPQEFVAVEDRFGESGKPAELLEKYGLGVKDIVEKTKKVIARKM